MNPHSNEELPVNESDFSEPGMELLEGLKDLDKETAETQPVYSGTKPCFRRYPNINERNKAIGDWIQKTLSELRLSRNCAAILCPTRKCLKEILNAMNALGIPITSETRHLDKPVVKVMTIFSCKGLEFPIVAIPDFRANAFDWLVHGDAQASEEIARRFYFGMSLSHEEIVCHDDR